MKRLLFLLFLPSIVFGQIVLEDPQYQNELQSAGTPFGIHVFETDPSGLAPADARFALGTAHGDVLRWDIVGGTFVIGAPETVTIGAIGDGPPNDATNDPLNPVDGDTYQDVDTGILYTYDDGTATWLTNAVTPFVAQPFQLVTVAQGVTTGDPVPETAEVYRTGDVLIGGADLTPVRSTGDIEFEVLNNAVFGSGTHVATGATNTLISGTTNTTAAVDTLALGGALNVVNGAASTTIGSQGTTITGSQSGGYGTNAGSVTSGSKNNLFGGSNNIVSGTFNTLVGGNALTLSGQRNTVVGGNTNSITGGGFLNTDNIVLSGRTNAMTSAFGGDYNSNAIIAGDTNALDAGFRNAIIAGLLNTMTGAGDSIITGGASNDIDQSRQSAIISGLGNTMGVNVINSLIGAGFTNTMTGPLDTSTITSDQSTLTNGTDMGIYSGEQHTIDSSNASVIVGGDSNSITGPGTFGISESNGIFVGRDNIITATAQNSAIVGGSAITVSQINTTAVPVLQSNNVAGVLPVVEGTETFTYNDAGELYVLDASGDTILISREQLGSGIVDPVGLPSTIIPGAHDDYTATWYNHVAQSCWVWDETNAIWYECGAANVAQPFQIIGTAQGATTGDAVPETAEVYRTGDVVIGGADLAGARSVGDIKFEALGNVAIGLTAGHTMSGAQSSLSVGGNTGLYGVSNTISTTSAIAVGEGHNISGISGAAVGGLLSTVEGIAAGTLAGERNTVTGRDSVAIGGTDNDITGGFRAVISGFTNTSSANDAITSGNTNTNFGTNSVVSGDGNTNASTSSLMVGGGNNLTGGSSNVVGGITITGTPLRSLIAGETIATGTLGRSVMVGTSNTWTDGNDNLLAGNGITMPLVVRSVIAGGTHTPGNVSDSLIVGGGTTGTGIAQSIIAGSTNSVTNSTDILAISQGSVFNDFDHSAVIGRNHTVGVAGNGSADNLVSGSANTIIGAVFQSVALGLNANIQHNKNFIFATDGVASVANSAFTVQATGGTRIFSDVALVTGVRLNTGTSAWAAVSLTSAKDNITALSGNLEQIRDLGVYSFQYKDDEGGVYPNIVLGPMADGADGWNTVVGSGTTDTTNATDLAGLALAVGKELESGRLIDKDGTLPVAVVATDAHIYNDGGEIFARDSGGNITQLTSHPGFAYEILSEAGLIAEWKLNLAVKPRINYTQNGDKGLIEYAGRTISLDGSTWTLHNEANGSVEQTGSF